MDYLSTFSGLRPRSWSLLALISPLQRGDMTCHIERPSVPGGVEALLRATAPLASCKSRDHSTLILEYPVEISQADIAAQLQQISGLQWRASGHRALIRMRRQGVLRKLAVKGLKPALRKPLTRTILTTWCGLGSEVTNMSENLSASHYVDHSLDVKEVTDIRARVFLAEFETEALPVVEGLTSIDPDLVWEARGSQALIMRGPGLPRRKALKAALQGARLLQFKGRPGICAIRRWFTSLPYWTNARSEADWHTEEETWSCPDTDSASSDV